ncbi:MAG TPA: hypothetical protein VJU82_09615, partial [Acidobacteriaceae bacterium]|nr:hypothetical protein [Acidobacteriaceae bacterium]
MIDRNSFAAVDQLYGFRNSAVVSAYTCEHPGLRRLCFAIRKFERTVEGDSVETWIDGLRLLRRIRSTALSLPLPFNHPAVCPPELVAQLVRWARTGTHADPVLGPAATELAELARELSSSSSQPLADLVLECILDVGEYPTALVLSNAGRGDAVEAFWAGLWDPSAVHVVAPAQLRGPASFQHAVMVGPVRWFPDHVFAAPRARYLSTVGYGFVSGNGPPEALLLGEPASTPLPWVHVGSSWSSPGVDASAPARSSSNHVDEPLDWQDILPRIEWDAIVASLPVGSTIAPEGVSYLESDVPARLLLLQTGMAVFLECEGGRAIIVDPEHGERPRVTRIAVEDIAPGMFVLLRTSGGGDYIAPLADEILGERAAYARRIQADWKRALIRVIQERGIDGVCRGLRTLGLRHANPGNVRRWCSERAIRTQEKDDLMTLLTYVGLSSRADHIWRVMKAIE